MKYISMFIIFTDMKFYFLPRFQYIVHYINTVKKEFYG